MALPNIQQAQYGDRVKMEKLAGTRMTNNPAADVQSMTGGAGGRPAETDPVKMAMAIAKQQASAGGTQQSPEQMRYAGMFNSLAEQYETALKWQRIASQPGAGRFTQWMAAQAIEDFKANLLRVRGGTPFFDGI